MTVIIDGINSLSPTAEAKGEVDIYCQLPICSCHMKLSFCQSFLFFFPREKYFEEVRNRTSKRKISSDGGEEKPLPHIIRKRTLKTLEIYAIQHSSVLYGHGYCELLYRTVKVMAYVTIFAEEQKRYLHLGLWNKQSWKLEGNVLNF